MDPTITADLEAPKDPGALKAQPSVTDNEILGELPELYTYSDPNINGPFDFCQTNIQFMSSDVTNY